MVVADTPESVAEKAKRARAIMERIAALVVHPDSKETISFQTTTMKCLSISDEGLAKIIDILDAPEEPKDA